MFQYICTDWSEEILNVLGHKRQLEGSVGPTRIFSLLMHWNEDIYDKNDCCKCLVRNLRSEKHVSIHMYRSEEILYVIGCRRQTQGSVGPTRTFSFEIKDILDKRQYSKCLMRNIATVYMSLLSYSHTVQSHCHTVIHYYSHTVKLSYCHTGSASHSHTGTVSHCHTVTVILS